MPRTDADIHCNKVTKLLGPRPKILKVTLSDTLVNKYMAKNHKWWNDLDIPAKDVKVLPDKNVCVFCRCSEDCQDKYGEFMHHTFSGMRMHYFCLLLASGLNQSHNEDEDNDNGFAIEKHSVYGFSISDIIQEVKRASKLRCVYCHKLGASIGCVLSACKTKCHFPCGFDNDILSQFYDSFNSFCAKHRPRQIIENDKNHCESNMEESTSANVRGKSHKNQGKELKPATQPFSKCPVCLEKVNCSLEDFRSLKTPCCCNVWLHRSCLQQQAHSSGLHFFRCPVCNDSDLFGPEMQRMGIYIPERDASWELAHDAFNDLLQRHNQCDVENCLCSHGRDYNLKGSKWAVVLCDLCGSSGTHIACSEDVDKEDSYYACQICTEIYGVEGSYNLAAEMGVIVPTKRPTRRSRRTRPQESAGSPRLKRSRMEKVDAATENTTSTSSLKDS